MAIAALKCPFCGSGDVRIYGTSTGNKRYACNNPECSHKTFYAEYACNGYRPDGKKAIIKGEIDGAGIRALARECEISTDTVIKELKKAKLTDYVNKEYLESHKNITVGVETDKMGFYHDKKHQVWLFFWMNFFGWWMGGC
jgi:transposase-like protein